MQGNTCGKTKHRIITGTAKHDSMHPRPRTLDLVGNMNEQLDVKEFSTKQFYKALTSVEANSLTSYHMRMSRANKDSVGLNALKN